MRTVGTVVRGIRTPIIRNGDNLEKIIIDSIKRATKFEKFKLRDKDVIGITEAVVSISQGNFVTLDQLKAELQKKFGKDKKVGVVFPILSRNRFSFILKALVQISKEVHVLFSYPSDEVGNPWVEQDIVDKKKVDPYKDSFEEDEFRKMFGKKLTHKFTGVDYAEYYKGLGDNVVVHFSNDPRKILKYTKDVLVSDIHTRFRTKKMIKEAGGKKVYRLDEICNKENKDHGFNIDYGVLGSNMVTSEKLKLFPRDCEALTYKVQKKIKKLFKKKVEVLVYGDGAFKDPVCKIWELADPVVSPGFTKGLIGTPNEVKLKYISENWDSKGSFDKYIKNSIKEKHSKSFEKNKSLGTTPRQLTDLLGSLCDLTSGSGDKGTPVILIQGYFDDYTVQ